MKNGYRFLIDTFCQSQYNLSALLGVIAGTCFWDVCWEYQERVEENSETIDIYFLSQLQTLLQRAKNAKEGTY